MPKNAERKHSEATHHAFPFSDLVYRALVFADLNGPTPRYYIAGLQGGPWSATNALTRSHRLHGGSCFYCKKKVTNGEATIDHVEPLRRGGSGLIQNLAICCRPCSADKGSKAIEHYKPDAGAEWLSALLIQVQKRLDLVSRASLQPPPSPGEAVDP